MTTAEKSRTPRMLDPFDILRSTRALAPHDPKLNDMRWLIGEALRRLFQRAQVARVRMASESATVALGKIHECAGRAGPAAWPIVTRIVIEGAMVRDCRGFVPEFVSPWRADAVVIDRLRVALDMLGPLLGVASAEGTQG